MKIIKSILWGIVGFVCMLSFIYGMGRFVGIFFPDIPVSKFHEYFYYMRFSFGFAATIAGFLTGFGVYTL